jgi:pimeloyl-ACP methyl ester carboxylesterase
MLQTNDVTARDVRLRVVECGEGPPLLLLHGFLMSHLAWDDVVPGFAGRFRVVTPDLPGFGDSEKPSPTRFAYGVEAYADCIADLIAAIGLGRTHLIGHGLSGAVAISLAARHPEFVDRLVLVDPHVYPHTRRSGVLELPVLGAFFFKQLFGRSLFRNYFRDRVFSPGFAMPLGRIDRFYELFNSPSARESAHAMQQAFSDTRPTVARLTRIVAPTFVIWGRDDTLYPSQLGPRLARELSAERLEVMETGHAPHMEQPGRFVETVQAFLDRSRKK